VTLTLKGRLCDCSPEEPHELVIGKLAGNTFYSFAESLRHQALVKVAGESDRRLAVRRLYDEPQQNVLAPFIAFADDVLIKIAQALDLKTEEIYVNQPPNHTAVFPFLLFDESEN
jgi:hypothetical protein